MKRNWALGLGFVAVLLGAPWFLQGMGLLHLWPILCFANCAPILRPATSWAIIGALTLIVGGLTILWPRRPTALAESKEIR